MTLARPTPLRATLAIAIATLAAPAWSQPASPADVARATARVDAVARGVMADPLAPPGLSMVISQASGPPIILNYGRRDLASGAPVTAATRFYIASMTKAYTGLLAADLDLTGVLDLDTRLDEAWPGLVVPGEGDLTKTTLRSWMAHEAPIANDTLNFLTGFVRPVPAADYRRMLSTWSSARPPGFRYTNTGYLVYAAALETRTGRSLPDWMAQRVFRPLRMSETSMRISDAPRGVLATGYVMDKDGAWTAAPLKSDGLMHAAGGIVTTPGDMGRWLAANLRRAGPGLPEADFAAAQAANAPMKIDREGLDCGGYGLGWYVCAYGGRRVLSHGGGYNGYGALMTIAPDAGVGIAVLGNSETAGLGFSSALTRVFLDALDPAKPEDAAAATAAMRARLAQQRERTLARVAKASTDPAFGDGTWRPAPGDLAAYVGRYVSDRLGTIEVEARAADAVARLGAMTFDLRPAAPDVFGGSSPGSPGADVFRFERDPGGRIIALLWGGRRFERR